MDTEAITAAEARRAELEEMVSHAEAEAAEARGALGLAVEARDDLAAERARRQLADAEQRRSDALAALPVATARVDEARAAVDAERRAAAGREADDLIRDRLHAAARVDAALTELAAALEEHERSGAALEAVLRAAGRDVPATMLARRSGAAIERAVWHASPALARALGLGRPTVAAHVRPLVTAETATLGGTAA
ncbi:MAG: hypothetical protein DCC71_06785 [Proteobacteria bacterium]|nr:MAG: hypothetical protein DCC71_06785 [Pseudomonadota bacterium]